MEYRNPQLPEGINTSRVHPLREFALLSLGALALIGALALTMGYFGGQLSRWLVSVETEEKWGQSLREKLDDKETPPPLRSYLDSLEGRIEKVMPLPAGMHLKLLYSDEDTVNAFATLGGTIILYRGLLEKIPHENALVMLIAHEMAHAESRDPIVSIGSAIGIQTALSLLLYGSEATPLQNAGLFTQLAFSRDMEQAADLSALQALEDIYGHVSGADDLFRVIQSERREKGDGEPPAFLSTHPLDEKRIAAIERISRERGWRRDLPTTPLPAGFKAWIAGDRD
ncbi:MAG: M48 family metallopeptidase [Desulfosarcinaceae bacterium]